jgi:GET complex subunit GET2
MMKMLQAMMGGMGGEDGAGDPNMPGGMGGIPGFSPDDISKATGIPSFLTNMFMGNQRAPPTKAELQATKTWKLIHAVFAIFAGLYLVFTIDRATQTYGTNPPAPATIQNPFMIFLTGEVLVQSARVISNGTPGKSGMGLWIHMGKEFLGDGAIMVFMLGLASWIKGMV